MLTSAAPGRTATTSYAWGDTEAEKRKHLLRQSVSPLGTVSTFQYDAYGNTIETQNNPNRSTYLAALFKIISALPDIIENRVEDDLYNLLE